MIQITKLKVTDVSEKMVRQFYRCSYKDMGHLFTDFTYSRNSKSTKCRVAYCIYNNKFAGWGMLYKMDGYSRIMLYVYKKYRRKGIGRAIVKKLANNKKLAGNFFFHKDSSNKEFFDKIHV